MKLFIQWTTDPPMDAIEIDSSQWSDLVPKRPVPVGTELIDNSKGYCCAVNCQGVQFIGYDHVAVEEDGEDVIITGWKDDFDDLPVGEHFARAMRFSPPFFDERIGQMNVEQSQILYLGSEVKKRYLALGPIQNTEIKNLVQFKPPAVERTIHGVWMPDELFARHEQARTNKQCEWMSYV